VKRTRRPSAQTLAVLRTLADDPGLWRYGYELCVELGMPAGSMYPILMRLTDRGLLDTGWEQQPAAGRPARHLYRLTGAGRNYAAEAIESAEPMTTAMRRADLNLNAAR
jgi:DNA-binding PadR family transcriptional regulator